jgi:hypothetical protein
LSILSANVLNVEIKVPKLKFRFAWRTDGGQNNETPSRCPAYRIARSGREGA